MVFLIFVCGDQRTALGRGFSVSASLRSRVSPVSFCLAAHVGGVASLALLLSHCGSARMTAVHHCVWLLAGI